MHKPKYVFRLPPIRLIPAKPISVAKEEPSNGEK